MSGKKRRHGRFYLWHRPGRHAIFRDVGLVDLDVKPEYLASLTKAGLGRIPLVAPLMMLNVLSLVLSHL